jgi:hypothetical protein
MKRQDECWGVSAGATTTGFSALKGIGKTISMGSSKRRHGQDSVNKPQQNLAIISNQKRLD